MEKFSEDKRKILHILMGLFALLLRWLPWQIALLCAFTALINNLTLLRWIGEKTLFRERERSGFGGIFFYPISVFLLILIFRNSLHIAGAGWGMMAFGDGVATLTGVHFGKKKLPWNNEKSWVGFLSSLIFGYLSMVFLIWWIGIRYGSLDNYKIFSAPAIVALFASLVETMKIRIDDNLTVPLFSGIFLYYLYLIEPQLFESNLPTILSRLPLALLFTLIFSILGYLIKGVNISGFLTGILIGTGIWIFSDYKGFLSLLLFFVLGTLSTKIGYSNKKMLGIEERDEGARSYKNVLGKGISPLLFSILSLLSKNPTPFSVAFYSSLCAGTFDTVSSELGKTFGKKTISPLSFKETRKGKPGGISLEGLIFGLLSSIIFIIFSLTLNPSLQPLPFSLALLLSSTISNIAESYISIFLEKKGYIPNEITNFLNTLISGVIGYSLYSATL